MPLYHKRPMRGLSLVETAIVLGVIGIFTGAIWTYARSAQQNGRVEQAYENLTLTVDAVRTAYAPMLGITGGVSVVVPFLVSLQALPEVNQRATATTCSGVSSQYVDTPWGMTSQDPCGTLRICAWSGAILNKGCNLSTTIPSNAQMFAMEYAYLDYPTCLALIMKVPSTAPAGLLDVEINTISANLAGGGIPVQETFASSQGAYVGLGCQQTNSNVVDFVYSLRPVNN